MRRFLFRVAAAIGSALTLGSLTSCAAAEAPGALQNDNPLGTFVGSLSDLPGVDHVDLDVTGQRADIYGLDITLNDDITADELATIGTEAAGFADTAAQASLNASQPKLIRGDSTFEYFDNLDAESLTAQLNYWIQLQHDDVESVSMSGYTERVTAAPGGNSAPGGHAVDAPDPRYIAIELPEDTNSASSESIMAKLRAITDPGSESGQWDVVVPDAHFKGEFHSAHFPTKSDYGYVAAVATTFTELDDLASCEVAFHPGADVPLNIEVVSFDDDMDNLAAEDADIAFQESAMWQTLEPLMSELRDRVNYKVDMLGSPLSDGGNFKFDFTVSGCAFTGDSEWPESSQALGEIWVHTMKEAKVTCTPEVETVP